MSLACRWHFRLEKALFRAVPKSHLHTPAVQVSLKKQTLQSKPPWPQWLSSSPGMQSPKLQHPVQLVGPHFSQLPLMHFSPAPHETHSAPPRPHAKRLLLPDWQPKEPRQHPLQLPHVALLVWQRPPEQTFAPLHATQELPPVPQRALSCWETRMQRSPSQQPAQLVQPPEVMTRQVPDTQAVPTPQARQVSPAAPHTPSA